MCDAAGGLGWVRATGKDCLGRGWFGTLPEAFSLDEQPHSPSPD